MDWALMSLVTFTQFLINFERYHYSMLALTLISYGYCFDVFKSSIRRFLDILEWFYGYNYYNNIGCCYFYTNQNSLRWLLFDRNETYRQGLQSVTFFIRKNSFCVYSVSRPLRLAFVIWRFCSRNQFIKQWKPGSHLVDSVESTYYNRVFLVRCSFLSFQDSRKVCLRCVWVSCCVLATSYFICMQLYGIKSVFT